MNPTLSLVVPCFNEAATLATCVQRIRSIASDECTLEIVIVDDASTDDSLTRARALAARHPEIKVFTHERNQGKGAALRTGFRHATGDFVAVQDADLEYDPADLLDLLEPLRRGDADAVLGSRYVRSGVHRVLPFWHSTANRVLTALSNAFSDLDITDMETCYKVFRREVIQSIPIEENRFGFEPEIVAKLAARRLRIYEKGIRYDARSVEEGKKLRAIDGIRALYCIVHYNVRRVAPPLRLAVYGCVASLAASIDLLLFAIVFRLGGPLSMSAPIAYGAAYGATIGGYRALVFPAEPGEDTRREGIRHAVLLVAGILIDLFLTSRLMSAGFAPLPAKLGALLSLAIPNYLSRRRFVFRRPPEDR